MNNKQVNDIIARLFEDRLNVRDMKVEDGKVKFGYYVSLQRRDYIEISKSDDLTQCFYTCMSKSRNIMIGETSQSDYENTFQQTLVFMYESMYAIFMGTRNDKVKEELQCNSIEDVYEILCDEKKTKALCKYVAREVELKFKALIKSKENVDSYYSNKENKFIQINYKYIDKEDNTLELANEEYEKRSGNLTDYILDTYMNSLTNAQQLFCANVIEYGIASDGSVYDLDNNLIYTKQQVNQFCKFIKKRLERLFEHDNHIDYVNGRIRYRD